VAPAVLSESGKYMSDYLNSLVSRTLHLAPVVQPRPVSFFEPVSAGPVDEAPFAVSENVVTQRLATPGPPRTHEPFAVPVQSQEIVFENAPPHTVREAQVLPPALLPTQVPQASTFAAGEWERTREVRDQELSSRLVETDSITSATETRRHQPSPSLIKPEVRIVSSASDREPVQPSLTAPPLANVPAYAARPDAFSQSSKLKAQAGDAADAPETVVVTIGRVDVRAIFAPPQAAPRAARTQPQPLSLDEYLKQRSEGRR